MSRLASWGVDRCAKVTYRVTCEGGDVAGRYGADNRLVTSEGLMECIRVEEVPRQSTSGSQSQTREQGLVRGCRTFSRS